MVKIIKGIYGYKDQNGTIIPKTVNDDPFKLTDEQEARLISKGVAVKVEESDDNAKPDEPAEVQGASDSVATSQQTRKDELEAMSYNGLKHLAAELELEASGKKEDIIERILKAEEEAGEEPPVLSPADPE